MLSSAAAAARRMAAVFQFSATPNRRFEIPAEGSGAQVCLYSDWQPYGGQTPLGPGAPAAWRKAACRGALAPFSAVLAELT